MKKYLVGVDLGTSSTKAALYLPDGTLISEASVEVPIYYPHPGAVEQENDDFYRTAAQTVKQCLLQSGIDPRQVVAIAFDSQMAGLGTIDEDFRPATRFDSWLDMRCQPYIEQINRACGDLITRLTGCPPTCDHGPKILWWQHEHPLDFARIARFIMPAGYVAGRTAGLKFDEAYIDHTFIHFSALSDAIAGQWSQELCARLEVDLARLPRIVAPWEIVGEVKAAAAHDFGLAEGTPIAAGAGDTAAGALGAGIVHAGMLFDTAGTAAVLAGCTDQFVADVRQRALLTMRSVVPGLWHPLAYIAGGGLVQRWYRDTFFNTTYGQNRSAQEDLYNKMAELADQVQPGAQGLFFSPHLGGRICPASPDLRGAWVGFSWGHTQAHFIRAILESVAYEYAYYLSILRELIPDLDLVQARVIGGGARNPLWNQIKADVLGVPYLRLQRAEFATWGCAMIAGCAVGLFNNLTTVAEMATAPQGNPFQPDVERHAIYEKLVEKYIHWQHIPIMP